MRIARCENDCTYAHRHQRCNHTSGTPEFLEISYPDCEKSELAKFDLYRTISLDNLDMHGFGRLTQKSGSQRIGVFDQGVCTTCTVMEKSAEGGLLFGMS